jgi:hypothetical protein
MENNDEKRIEEPEEEDPKKNEEDQENPDEHEKQAKDRSKRMNIYVDADISDEWKDWAENIGSSVSELVRKSMNAFKNIGDLKKLEKLGKTLEKYGEDIEKAINESGVDNLGETIKNAIKDAGLEDIGKRIEKTTRSGKIKPRIVIESEKHVDRERLKKRVKGLIILQKSIPIVKLAQVLEISKEDAMNLIYELAGEGIDGIVEGDVFKFTSEVDDVIDVMYRLIEAL